MKCAAQRAPQTVLGRHEPRKRVEAHHAQLVPLAS
ncbi:uncharacterized protein METZ01_LOCUS176228, partial [marine metagenome]